MTHRPPDRSDRPAALPDDDPDAWQAYLDALEVDLDRLGGRIGKLERQLGRRLRWWPAYLVARVAVLVGALYLLEALLQQLSGPR